MDRGTGAGAAAPVGGAIPELRTARLRLRAYRPSDFEALFLVLVLDPVVVRFWHAYGTPGLTEADKRTMAERDLGTWIEEGMAAGLPTWIIEAADPAVSAAGDVVGTIGVFPAENEWGPEPEVGYLLASRFHGRGLATEALAAVVADATERLGIRSSSASSTNRTSPRSGSSRSAASSSSAPMSVATAIPTGATCAVPGADPACSVADRRSMDERDLGSWIEDAAAAGRLRPRGRLGFVLDRAFDDEAGAALPARPAARDRLTPPGLRRRQVPSSVPNQPSRAARAIASVVRVTPSAARASASRRSAVRRLSLRSRAASPSEWPSARRPRIARPWG